MAEMAAHYLPHVVAVVLALIAWRKEITLKRLEHQLKVESDKPPLPKRKANLRAVEVALSKGFLPGVKQYIMDVFDRTSTEKFSIVFAINGKSDFNHVTVIYEVTRNSGSALSSLAMVEVKIDEQYRTLIKTLEAQGWVGVQPDKKDNTLISTLAVRDNTADSLYHFLSRQRVDEENDVVIFSVCESQALYNHEEINLIRASNLPIVTASEELIIHNSSLL